MKKRGFLRYSIKFLLLLSLSYLVLSTSVIGVYTIPSKSMYPNMEKGDLVLVNKMAYSFNLFSYHLFSYNSPDVGDIVVFQKKDSQDNYIKRIVAERGDVVEVIEDLVHVNGYPLYEKDYIFLSEKNNIDRRSSANFGPLKVRDGQFFVLGDNRRNSLDSRVFGSIDLENILGRAELVVDLRRLKSPRRSGAN